MKKIGIYLQYPWKFPDSPYYKYLTKSPPKNIKYTNVKKQAGAITNRKKFWFLTRLKVNIRRWSNYLHLPIANAWLTDNKNKFNLIHCAHCLSMNNSPWVADMESVWSMWVSGMDTRLGVKRVRKILLNPSCKKIMPWTKHTEKEILKIFPEIEEKVELVYPAVPFKSQKEKKPEKDFTITFIGRDFRLKGGKIALETMRKIKILYPNAKMIFVSSLPEDIKHKYPGVEMYDLLPSDKIAEILSKTDLFLYTSLMDTFGFAIVESMSYGIPTIALKTQLTPAIDEIITNNINGVILRTKCTIDDQSPANVEETSDSLLRQIAYLMAHRELLKNMSKNCLAEVKAGKFSIKERNRKLKEIYKRALE
jgi:glycosyltransferase involved in cell wall biosynthesis